MIELINREKSNLPHVLTLRSNTWKGAVEELVNVIYKSQYFDISKSVSREEVINAVVQREMAYSTGIGEGLAFPHARIDGWGKVTVVAGISQNGIDFASADENPVKLIFLIISSTEEAYVILQTMSAILKTLKKYLDFNEFADGHISAESISNIFDKTKVDPTEYIRASHIACPVGTIIHIDSPIEECAKIIHRQHIDILPVIDDKNLFCGEISYQDVFCFGMPDFFNRLNTVSFVKYIDPFDKFFQLKKSLKVRDLYRSDVKPLTEENTLMEVIFEMTVKKRSKLFLVNNEGQLTGLIDKFSIIDKILFF